MAEHVGVDKKRVWLTAVTESAKCVSWVEKAAFHPENSQWPSYASILGLALRVSTNTCCLRNDDTQKWRKSPSREDQCRWQSENDDRVRTSDKSGIPCNSPVATGWATENEAWRGIKYIYRRRRDCWSWGVQTAEIIKAFSGSRRGEANILSLSSSWRQNGWYVQVPYLGKVIYDKSESIRDENMPFSRVLHLPTIKPPSINTIGESSRHHPLRLTPEFRALPSKLNGERRCLIAWALLWPNGGLGKLLNWVWKRG